MPWWHHNYAFKFPEMCSKTKWRFSSIQYIFFHLAILAPPLDLNPEDYQVEVYESFDERLINEKQQTSTINVQFITTKPNVSCWVWVSMEKQIPQSELDYENEGK